MGFGLSSNSRCVIPEALPSVVVCNFPSKFQCHKQIYPIVTGKVISFLYSALEMQCHRKKMMAINMLDGWILCGLKKYCSDHIAAVKEKII